MTVRRVAEADLAAVVELVHGLADYERAADQCHLTVERLRAALFGPEPAVFGHVALAPDGEVVGCALWYLSYSTWEGAHGIFLEDLFVRPEHRGGGYGRALMVALARECAERGYPRLHWQVLDWNEPSLRFYQRLGAGEEAGWLDYRLTGEGLRALAAEPSPAG